MVSGTVLAVLLLLGFSLAVNIKPVKCTWTGTVYIRSDGTIDPSDAPITTSDYITYTLTANITSPDEYSDGIIVEKDNIIIDGNGFTVNGWRYFPPKGIYLYNRVNVSIQNIRIEGFCYGIYLNHSSSINIVGSKITAALYTGIVLWDCSNHNSIIGNDIIANDYDGVYIANSSSNHILRNNIEDNSYGIYIWGNSSGNIIYHNNFINTGPATASFGSVNIWDNGYPFGGNYWSDYEGVDSDKDGIGDTPYYILEGNVDNYPLMGSFRSFSTPLGPEVDILSNSTIMDFQYFESNGTITMHVSNSTDSQTCGFCRLTIPHSLMQPPYIIMVNNAPVDYNIVFENETLTIIYFEYHHSTIKITIVPEIPNIAILTLLTFAAMLAVIWAKKRKAESLREKHLNYNKNGKVGKLIPLV
jgi:parallel beta-helix repeat protein